MDYKKLGFKCGIEIHQQLDTDKLFCNCPSIIRKDNPDFIIKRFLSASAGESGRVDAAARHEHDKFKYFLYHGYDDSTCLVECDDEPPHEVNPDALLTVLQVAKFLKADIVDKVQFMRKVVVDGSNVSGFQRTALIARNGSINIGGKPITISAICLEEEACQKVSSHKDHEVFNLSRLGIPLIEIATDPVISSPDECKRVAEHLGMVLRSTEKVKRGIGSIRQDVNVSIKEGVRVEVKGFQDLKSIPKVIDFEVKRQLKNINLKKVLVPHVRKANQDFSTSFLRPMPGADRMYPETDVEPIEVTKSFLSNLPGVNLISDTISDLENKFDISHNLASEIIKKKIPFIDYINDFKNVDPSFIAKSLIDFPKEIKSRFKLDIDILLILPILKKLDSNMISKDAVFEIILLIAGGKEPVYSSFRPLSKSEIEKHVKKVISSNKGAPVGALMGFVMKDFRGKVDGKVVMELIKKNV